jgi:hypothetical protein
MNATTYIFGTSGEARDKAVELERQGFETDVIYVAHANHYELRVY